ncbi:MAG TPA: alpha-amylase family glycosyl hydrolase [Candidatus Limnocylindrales bacterium]|nr:alpha-amylase family glycosyl hydrolase [Candidatus Limnocylindrales bacterium]
MSAPAAFAYRPHPHLYEINTRAWLEELSAKYGRTIALRDVPSSEWDAIAGLGFDFVWLMGVWERSPVGRRFFQTDAASFPSFDQALPGWKLSEIAGSPYSVRQYHPDPRIAAWAGLDQVRETLRARHIGLILDFVTNHTAPDHPWTASHPEYYIRGSQDDFRKDPSAFYLAETNAEPHLFAHGRDPYFPPWRDVVQLDYFEPSARSALLAELREMAKHCDGVRCDMAMLVLNDIFARTWSALLADRKAPPREFWSEAIAAVPEFLWLAEVYWNCEVPMQSLGFQFTYDKGLYDALRDGHIDDVHARLGEDTAIQSCSARFLENHDEARSAAVFGAAKLEAFGTLIATLPGMRFYHHGQLDGRKIHLPMPLAFAAAEPPDAATRAFYERILKLSNESVFHSGQWQLLEIQSGGDDTFRNLVAYQWLAKNSRKVVIVNLAGTTSQARVRFPAGISASQEYSFLDQLHDLRYPRNGDEIAQSGLYVRLDPYRAHLFDITPL